MVWKKLPEENGLMGCLSGHGTTGSVVRLSENNSDHFIHGNRPETLRPDSFRVLVTVFTTS